MYLILGGFRLLLRKSLPFFLVRDIAPAQEPSENKNKTFQVFFLFSGDLGGIRTRDCLDENQESWTARRRDRTVKVTYPTYKMQV